ncbi:MAG: MFS transporter [Rhodobacteraceae bacterium]|jgi:MFS family permease|uniref:MFS transporter n=1 Tax=Salipiger TaxID=263377 RepID=UPI0008F24FFA|nr:MULTISPECIES: MFS transporter [Salipiger]MAB05319.1 MFS transporter [Paracoccaceae bacterium]GGA24644.1 MFS transporter [Salipiger profundus]SFD84719.1 Predicted arabinose efflux permease, MFS family [Salipiger profundus]
MPKDIPSTETQDEPSRAPLVIIALATLVSLATFSAPLTALEAMTASLSLSSAEQAWVMSAMPLGCAVGLLSAGALGDTLGRRRTFVGGLVLMALASVAAALSPTGFMLIIARVVQGLGSAGVMACGLGLLGQVYHGAARQRAAAIWAAGLGGGAASGPVLTAMLLPVGDWMAAHWLLAVVSGVLAVQSEKLPESARIPHRVDIAGSILLMIGLSCLLAALTELRMGLTATVVALVGIAVVALCIFVRIERRVSNPILRLDLFGHAPFIGATLAALASGAGVLSLMSLVPTFLERGIGLDPFAASLITLAWSGVTVIAAVGARYLPQGLTPRAQVYLAILGCALGQLLLLLSWDGMSWWVVLPGLLVAGMANGILNAALGHAAVESVPPERSTMGSAANNTARYIGSALGIALVSVLIASSREGDFFTHWHQAVLATSLMSLLGLLAMVLLNRQDQRQAA